MIYTAIVAMKRALFFAAGLLIIAIVVILGFFLFDRSENTRGLSLTQKKEAAVEEKDFSKELQQALVGEGSLQCEFMDERGNKGVAYVKNGMVRADVTDTKNGEVDVIFKENTSWIWVAKTKKGFKFSVPQMEDEEASKSNYLNQNIGYEKEKVIADIQQYKKSCKQQPIADDIFTPPADVSFKEMSMPSSLKNIQ